MTHVAVGVLGTDGTWKLSAGFASGTLGTVVSAPRVASFGGGLLALVWIETDPSAQRLKAKVISISGEDLSGELILAEGLPQDLESPSAMGLHDGSFVVVWLQDLHDATIQHQAVFLQRVNSSGGKMWGQCNNGLCDASESCESCPKDCGLCGE